MWCVGHHFPVSAIGQQTDDHSFIFFISKQTWRSYNLLKYSLDRILVNLNERNETFEMYI